MEDRKGSAIDQFLQKKEGQLAIDQFLSSRDNEKTTLANSLIETKNPNIFQRFEEGVIKPTLSGLGKFTGVGTIGEELTKAIVAPEEFDAKRLAGGVLTAGSFAIPGGAVTKGAGIVTKIGSGLATGMATGAVAGAGQALVGGEDVLEGTLKGAAIGGTIGAGLPVLVKTGGALAKIIKKSGQQRLDDVIGELSIIDDSFKPLKQKIDKGLPLQSDDLAILSERYGDEIDVEKLIGMDREAKKAATELLQPGRKATAGRIAEFSKPAESATDAIRATDKQFKTFDELANYFDEEATKAHEEVLKVVRRGKKNFKDSYLKRLKTTIDDLRSDPQFSESADIYEDVFNREVEWIKKQGKITPAILQKRKQELGKRVGKLYEQGQGKDLLPEQQARVQAIDDIRGGAQDVIAEQYPAVAGLNQKSSGLIDSAYLARIQRERANNAISDPKFRDLLATDKVAALNYLKERLPFIRDIGKTDLTKLDTKSDILESLIPAKVNQIRRTGEAIQKSQTKLKVPRE